MKEKRKISVRKVLQVFLTVVVSLGCLIAIVSASRIEDAKKLSGVAVHIKNDKKYHFIEEKEIMDLAINNRDVDVMNTPMSQLDIKGMEQVIASDPWVAGVQVFIDNDKVLHMHVTQRVPIARIFQQDSKSYYMDGSLSIMPLSENYVYYTTVVTNVPELNNDSAGWAMKKEIAKLVSTIQQDTFWSAQISQVIADTAGTFVLMPVLGDQKILLGDTSRMKDKLDDLFAFYKNVLNRIGWDKYETLDLRFKGQVIASPSMPYSGPVDKAVSAMNWINSIIETEAKNDGKDSAAAPAPVVKPAPVVHAAAPPKVAKTISKEKPKEKPKAKPTAKPEPKKTANKAHGNDKQEHANAQAHKAKPDNKSKQQDNHKEKNKKPGTPKYVYPEKKEH